VSARAIVCESCEGGSGLSGPLAAGLAAAGIELHVAKTACMQGCARPVTVAFRGPGRMAWLFAGVGAGDVPDLVTFARLWLAAPAGEVTDARPLGALRMKAIGRIPA